MTRRSVSWRDGGPGYIRVAYETLQPATWRGSSVQLAGRTFEEAFALQNLDWCQASQQKALGLCIRKANELDLAVLHEKIHDRVKGFDKTRFALGLIGADINAWSAPQYIIDGLKWLSAILQVEPALAVEAAVVAAYRPRGDRVTQRSAAPDTYADAELRRVLDTEPRGGFVLVAGRGSGRQPLW